MSCSKAYYENHWTGRMNRRLERLLTSVMPQGKLFLYYADPQWSKRTSNLYGGLQLGVGFPVRLKDEAELLSEQLGNVGFQTKKAWHFTGNTLVTRMLAAAGLEPDYETLPHYYPRPGSAWYHAKPAANVFKRTRKAPKRAAATSRQAMRKAS